VPDIPQEQQLAFAAPAGFVHQHSAQLSLSLAALNEVLQKEVVTAPSHQAQEFVSPDRTVLTGPDFLESHCVKDLKLSS